MDIKDLYIDTEKYYEKEVLSYVAHSSLELVGMYGRN